VTEQHQPAAAAPTSGARSTGARLAVLAAIVLVVGGVVVAGVVQSRQSAPSVAADAATPTTISDASAAQPWGVRYNSAPGKPTLAIWEDFQCPFCAELEAANGAGIVALADAGKVNLIWRPTTFIDQGEGAVTGPNPLSSHRATTAWGCAIDAGKAREYHALLFAQQAPPAHEGRGWSDQQLLDFATQVGITGDAKTAFDACYASRKYDAWVTNSYAAFTSEAVPGTPAGYLDGTELTPDQLADPAVLAELVGKATT
jgi:protein-disulfide isomerase